MAYYEAKHHFITAEHSQTEAKGEKKIGGGEAGLAKVSWAAPAPQWSFNWTSFVSKLNISVWAFKKRGKEKAKEEENREEYPLELSSLRIFGGSVLSKL